MINVEHQILVKFLKEDHVSLFRRNQHESNGSYKSKISAIIIVSGLKNSEKQVDEN